MPVSEIDDIFAGKAAKASLSAFTSTSKGKAKAVDGSSLPSSTSVTKKSKKKRKRQEADDERAEETSRVKGKGGGDGSGYLGEDEDDTLERQKKKKEKSKRPRVVETVQDPSAALPSVSSSSIQQKLPKSKKNKSKSVKEGGKGDDNLDRFMDSRGTGPRKRTEEGFLVYKEDELGIRGGGGDTPLCPFDCNCCF